MRFDEVRERIATLPFSVRGSLEEAAMEGASAGYGFFDPMHVLLTMAKLSPSLQIRKRLHMALGSTQYDLEGEYDALQTFMVERAANQAAYIHGSHLAAGVFFTRMRMLAERRSEAALVGRGDLLIAAFASKSPLIRDYLDDIERPVGEVLQVLQAPSWIVLEFIETGIPTP